MKSRFCSGHSGLRTRNRRQEETQNTEHAEVPFDRESLENRNAAVVCRGLGPAGESRDLAGGGREHQPEADRFVPFEREHHQGSKPSFPRSADHLRGGHQPAGRRAEALEPPIPRRPESVDPVGNEQTSLDDAPVGRGRSREQDDVAGAVGVARLGTERDGLPVDPRRGFQVQPRGHPHDGEARFESNPAAVDAKRVDALAAFEHGPKPAVGTAVETRCTAQVLLRKFESAAGDEGLRRDVRSRGAPRRFRCTASEDEERRQCETAHAAKGSPKWLAETTPIVVEPEGVDDPNDEPVDDPNDDPIDLLGSTGAQVMAEARRRLARGYGRAREVYQDAVFRGRFAPEFHGLAAESAAGWRRHFVLRLPRVTRTHEEAAGAGERTVKAVLALHDGLEVECVRIPMGSGRTTLCVSSQVGCRLACAFCETAKLGLLRNLTPSEIVAQVVVARAVLGWSIRNIVFMGMGEPMDNADAVVQALRVLTDRRGLSYGQQRITVCTAGRPDGLEKLARLGFTRLDIAVSLNAATDEKRNRLMPVNRRVPLADLQRALVAYPRRRGYVYAINYCLLPGINDTRDDARAVAEFCRPLGRVLVNVIGYNPGSKPLARAPRAAEVSRFTDWLTRAGVPARPRVTKGRSVMAACGQLGNVELRRRGRTLPTS